MEFPSSPVHYEKLGKVEMKEPPQMGEDSDAILKDLLGYSESKMRDLRNSKVI